MKEDAKETKHPSYGLLEINRVSGVSTLFGSSIEHNHYVRVRIKRAVEQRDLHHTWYYDDHDHPDIVEVDMSMAQFAEAITSLNYGRGTPCTIRRVNGEAMPDPKFKSIREEFKEEFKEKMSRLSDGLAEKVNEIKAMLVEKKNLGKADRAFISSALDRLVMEVGCNVPFVHDSFNEAVDKTVMVAKIEVETFLTNTVMNAGHKALQESGQAPRLLTLENKQEGQE